MATYILPEDAQSEVEHTLVMGWGFADAIDMLANELLNVAAKGDEANTLLAILGCARHLSSTLKEANNRLRTDFVNMEELPGEKGDGHE